MLRQSRCLVLLVACLLLASSLAAAAELEGFDEVEDEPPAVVQDPVKAVRSPGMADYQAAASNAVPHCRR